MGLLDDRVAIITGASKGIGRVMSQLFAREGAKVVCAARSDTLVRETAAMIGAWGGHATAVVADAATEAGARAIVEAGVSAFGRVDTLINNAGDGGPTRPVQEYTTDEWFYTVNSCLTSAYLCSRFAVPLMIAAGRGAIVNIASMAGRWGLPYRVGYCAAKAGQIGMTYGLALELGWAILRLQATPLGEARPASTVYDIGLRLFRDYAFAFEATSVLILVAMVGAVVLARKERP